MSDLTAAIICAAAMALFFLAVVARIYATRPGGQRRASRGMPGFGRDGVVPSRHRRRRSHRPDGADRVDVAALQAAS